MLVLNVSSRGTLPLQGLDALQVRHVEQPSASLLRA